MGISTGSSVVYMPDTWKQYPAFLEFLVGRFPNVSAQTWVARIAAGKVLTEEGQPVTLVFGYTMVKGW